MTLYSDLDPLTELEQKVAADLERALSKRGATVKHHGTAAGHAPSSAPADITIDWSERRRRRRLLVEVAKRTDESEFTSLVSHLDSAVSADPKAKIDVLYSGLSTSVRMARFLRNENQRRKDKNLPGRLIFLALDRLQKYLEHWATLPANEAPLTGLTHATDRWSALNTDVDAARVLQAELFPQWTDQASALDAESQRELAVRQERLRKDITGLENRLRELGITGTRAHKALIHLFFFALYEDKRGEDSRASREGFESYKTSMTGGDRKQYADRTIHQIFERQLFHDPDIQHSGLLAQYEPIDLGDAFVSSSVLPIFERYPLSADGIDFIGAVFEALARRAEKDNRIGQFFTPETAAIATVELAGPEPSDTVLDPACGTARFLIHAMGVMLAKATASSSETKEEVERRVREERLLGTDIDPWLATIAKMNMYLHGDGKSNIVAANGLALSARDIFDGRNIARAHEAIDVVLTNPPLGDIDFRAAGADLARAGLLGELREAVGSKGYERKVESLAAEWSRERLSVVPHTCLEDLEEARHDVKVAEWDAKRLAAVRADDIAAEKKAERFQAVAAGKLADVRARIASGDLTYKPAGSKAKGGALFLSAILDYLKPERRPGWPAEWQGGVVGFVIDEAVLNTQAYAHARTFLTDRYFLKAVVSLPRNAFEFLAKTTAKTSILLLVRKPDPDVVQREPVFFARADTIGYTSTGVDPRNDLPEIVEAFASWRNGAFSAWKVASLNSRALEAAASSTPRLGGRVSLRALDSTRPDERLDVAYIRMREIVEALPSMQPIGSVLESVVRTPQARAIDADAMIHTYASVSGVDGRVRSRGEQDLKYAAKDLRVLAENDVLVSGIDAVRGAIGVVDADCEGHIVSKEFFTFVVRPDQLDQVDPWFIARLLRTPTMRAILEGAITGVSNRTRLDSPAEFLSLPMPSLPSNDEQRAIAEKVKGAFLAQDQTNNAFVDIEQSLDAMS